tara:strand:- start:1028 stop:1546 length:519 start_codon:yes stop_codon:yes gene_type:complete
MKLSRQKLRQLILKTINETRIKPGIPGLDPDMYGNLENLARVTDEQPVADDLATSLGYPYESFSGDMQDYDAAGRVTIERVGTVGSGRDTSTGVKEVSIPYDLVDGVIDAHQQVMQGGGSSAERLFNTRARAVFDHIDREAQPDYVDQYGLKTSGYRAKEYNDAMNAVGEYL